MHSKNALVVQTEKLLRKFYSLWT